jgi:uncharacterized protein with HEPN domain
LFQRSFGLFSEQVYDLESFREKVSKKLLVVCREMEELKEMFQQFEEAQRNKASNQEWFADRKNLYDLYLKVDADKIVICIQDAIKKAKEQLRKLEKEKAERI